MSLEIEIKNLTAAILELKSTLDTNYSAFDSAVTSALIEPATIEPTVSEPENDVNLATVELVKALCKTKLASGIDRTVIKEIISSCGGATLLDLDQDGLDQAIIKIGEL